MNTLISICLMLLCIVLWQTSAAVDDYRKRFKQFQLNFNKYYETDAEERRREIIFLKNLAFIEQHNQNYMRNLSSFELNLNEYADWTEQEFQRCKYGSDEQQSGFNEGATYLPPANVQIPDAVDWRELGAVTPVKNQLKCGSCWAFATTGVLEGQQFRKTSTLVTLSEQNLLDCTVFYGNKGCEGGNKERTYLYIRDNGGIDTETSYPYRAQPSGECLFDATTIGAQVKGFVSIAPEDENALVAAVATVGPIAVSINAGCLPKMQFYKRGLLRADKECDKETLTHAMLIVGYGKDAVNGTDYWIVKNSWGDRWGMDGYVLMPRGENFSGIAMRPSYPLV